MMSPFGERYAMRFSPDPFPLREARERALSYLRRADMEFSPVLSHIVE